MALSASMAAKAKLRDINIRIIDEFWQHLASGEELADGRAELTLQPYQSVWLSNEF